MADIEMVGSQDVLAGMFSQLDSSTTRHYEVRNRERSGNRIEAALHRELQQDGNGVTIDMDSLNEHVKSLNSRFKEIKLNFEVNDSSGQITVRIIDRETGDVLRTIPPSSVLDLQESHDLEKGLLVDSQS